jgi:cytochrome b involved in lipid metabolism
MKKLCYSAFIAFWASITTILALHTLADTPPNTDTPNTDKQANTYTLADVAKHASESDCWMAIENKVYNLTDYLNKHPVGPSMVVPWCGAEATEGMRSKGIGSDHSSFAWGQLNSYYIGDLK